MPKFRAWDKNNNEMISWRYLLNGYNLRNVFMRPEMCGLVLMQSTGMKDKNGVDIFEGDLVKITVSNGFDHLEDALSIVKEAKYHSGLICELLSNTLEYRIFDEEATGYQYEIVGNIYENPELLDQSNES